MYDKKRQVALLILLLCIFLTIITVSCNNKTDLEDNTPIENSVDDIEKPNDINEDEIIDDPVEDETPPPPPPPEIELFPYDGEVVHLFFHEVIAYPEMAFDYDSMHQGYVDYFVTADEYIKILQSLYDKGYILVDMNDVWSQYTTDNGSLRMKKNTLMLPEGKKPLILSFDDISFYEYMKYDGFMRKLIIGEDGNIWASGIDRDGNPIITRDLAAVTILDKFVESNPDFSLGGVKGCLALTGYEGILGYRTQSLGSNATEDEIFERTQEIIRVRPVIAKLKETGWYFASHSYGHIDFSQNSYDRVRSDADRWALEVGSLLGDTVILIYPYGGRLDNGDVFNTGSAFKYYSELGFLLFASVGYEPFTLIKSDICAVVCDRMNVDGIAFRTRRDLYLRLYDAYDVLDPLRPAF